MRKYFLILILGLSLNGLAQQIDPYNKIVTFFSDTNIYDEKIYSVVSTDSNLYLLMWVRNNIVNSHLIIVKTDLYGNKIAHKDLASDTSGHFLCYPDNSLLLDKDTNLLVLGHYWYSNEQHGQLIKLNSNLDILWDSVYHMPDSLMGPSCTNGKSLFTAIRQTPDGGYIINGFYYLDCASSQNAQKLFLQKIDNNGNIEWRKLYPNLSWSFDIEVAADSGYFLTTNPFTSTATYLNKMDKYGNLQYQIQDVPFMNITYLDSNHIVAAASFFVDISLDFRAIKVAKINIHNKSIVWEKKYYPARTVRHFEIHQSLSLETRNGFIYIGTSAMLDNHNGTEYGYKGLMMKLNGDGDSLWSRSYGYDSLDFNELSQFYDFCFLSDNEIVAVGYNELRNPDWTYCRPGWIVKMDSNGMAPQVQTVGLMKDVKQRNIIELIAYPNPASTNITIELATKLKQKAICNIFDTMGKKIFSKHISKAEEDIIINIANYPQGVYFYQIIEIGNITWSGKFIKE